MAIFTVISQPSQNADQFPLAVDRHFPEDNLQLTETTWLIAAAMSATMLSDKLGVSDGTNGSAIVLEVDDYFGRASKNIWSWIKEKWEATTNG